MKKPKLKLKLSLGEGGIKGALIRHVEKIGLGVAIVLVLLFIYSGAKQEGYSKLPADLKAETERADAIINQDTWEERRESKGFEDTQFSLAADEAQKDSVSAGYTLTSSLIPPIIPPQTNRRDPKLYAPVDIEVTALMAPVLWPLGRNEVDPYIADTPAVYREEPEEESKTRPRSRPRSRPRTTRGEEEYAEFDPAEFAEVPAASNAGQLRKLSADYINALPGYRPPAVEGTAAKSRAVVSIKALIPIEKQSEEYVRAFRQAAGYVAERDDQPNYVYATVYRADVTDDPNKVLTDDDWVAITNTQDALNISKVLKDVPKEIVDDPYLLNGIATHPVPPVLLTELDPLARHSKIKPKLSDEEIRLAASAAGADPKGPAALNLEEGPPVADLSTAPSIPAAEPNPGIAPREQYPEEFVGPTSEHQGEYPGAMAMREPEVRVEFKMLRFFDYRAKPGRKYRYRVQMTIEDPNRPRDPRLAPPLNILDANVVKRMKSDPENTWYRKTPFSDPSEVVSVSANRGEFLAVDVERSRSTSIGDRGAAVELEEPVAKVLTVAWDAKRATHVPAEREFRRGSLLNFTADADVLHPIKLQLLTVSQFPFKTNAVLADVDGGQALPGGDKDNPLHSPGEVVLVKPDGSFDIQNELDDEEAYRRYMFLEDQPSGSSGASHGYDSYPSEYEEGRGFDELFRSYE